MISPRNKNKTPHDIPQHAVWGHPFTLPYNYNSYFFVWDVDKTYLATHIESFGKLIKTYLEKPTEKRNIAGSVSLIRALNTLRDPVSQVHCPLVFVTATPPQLREKLEQKMNLDKIKFDAIFYKDQLHHIKTFKFRQLYEHVGYKLRTLIHITCSLPSSTQICLFGDDAEKDPLIYSLFCDVIRKRFTPQRLTHVLQNLGVEKQFIQEIKTEVEHLPPDMPAPLCFIHLEKHSLESFFEKYHNPFFCANNLSEMAVGLFLCGVLDVDAICAIVHELEVLGDGFLPSTLLTHGARRMTLMPMPFPQERFSTLAKRLSVDTHGLITSGKLLPFAQYAEMRKRFQQAAVRMSEEDHFTKYMDEFPPGLFRKLGE